MNNRPTELNEFISNQCEHNDEIITNAFVKLENSENWSKLKPTVSTICKLTGLSRNTVRNRSWALDRLKSLKRKRKEFKEQSITLKSDEDTDSSTLVDQLRSKIKELMNQNVLLYQEIVTLQTTIKRKDMEIKLLKPTKIY